MALENVGSVVPAVVAGADLSAKQFYLVKPDTNALKVVLAGDGDACIGVLQNKPTSGQAATVYGPGSLTKCIAGANGVTAGDKVASDGLGKADIATTGEFAIGFALETATSGQLFTLYIMPQGRVA